MGGRDGAGGGLRVCDSVIKVAVVSAGPAGKFVVKDRSMGRWSPSVTRPSPVCSMLACRWLGVVGFGTGVAHLGARMHPTGPGRPRTAGVPSRLQETVSGGFHGQNVELPSILSGDTEPSHHRTARALCHPSSPAPFLSDAQCLTAFRMAGFPLLWVWFLCTPAAPRPKPSQPHPQPPTTVTATMNATYHGKVSAA